MPDYLKIFRHIIGSVFVCIPGTVPYKEQTILKPPVKDLREKYPVLECTRAFPPYLKYLIPPLGNTDPLTVPFPRDPLSVTLLFPPNLPISPSHTFVTYQQPDFLRSFTPFTWGYQLNCFEVHGRSLSLPNCRGVNLISTTYSRYPSTQRSLSFHSSFFRPQKLAFLVRHALSI